MGSAEHPVTIELNPQERRLYDRLRAVVVEPRPGSRSGLRDVLLLLPDLCVLMLRLVRDPQVPRGAKAMALLGLGYAVSPIDLLPDLVLGPIGWIDDVLVMAASLSWIVNRVHPDLVRHHWPGQGDALDAIQRVVSWAEEQFRGALHRLAPAWLRR
jgi:uncharacterized membrane protein YkvA (DUF1232 family)